MKNNMDIKELAAKFDMSPFFVRKIKTMYTRMANKGIAGLSQEEYSLYRTYCERFATNIISKLKDDLQ